MKWNHLSGLSRPRVVAGEQSTGTFVKLAAETQALREQSAARVESVDVISLSGEPALPCKQKNDRHERGIVTISWPLENFGSSLATLQATVAGNLFELSELSAIRLLDINIPDLLIQQFQGPRFGIDGTRKLTGVSDGPVVGTIIKPSVGLGAKATAQLVSQLAAADIDFIKDDELQANGPHCPFTERVDAVMDVLNRHEDKTGKRIMYAFNMTDDIESMRRHYDYLLQKRACCAMVSLFSVGLSGLQDVCRRGELAIHADHLHVNGFANKFSEADQTVAESAMCVQAPLSSAKSHIAMPVFSSAQTIWQMEPCQRVLGNTDFILTAGGGIMSHPQGPTAGVVALRQAAEAAGQGVNVPEAAKHHSELAAAAAFFKQPFYDI